MREAIVLKKKEDEVLVENTLQSFLDYYTTTNKKSMIKHPFFVCYRFSNCFTMYYNSRDFKDSYNVPLGLFRCTTTCCSPSTTNARIVC